MNAKAGCGVDPSEARIVYRHVHGDATRLNPYAILAFGQIFSPEPTEIDHLRSLLRPAIANDNQEVLSAILKVLVRYWESGSEAVDELEACLNLDPLFFNEEIDLALLGLASAAFVTKDKALVEKISQYLIRLAHSGFEGDVQRIIPEIERELLGAPPSFSDRDAELVTTSRINDLGKLL